MAYENEKQRSEMECIRCRTGMHYLGQLGLRTGGVNGGWELLLGAFADLDERVIYLDMYRCSKYRKLEFFDHDMSLPVS